MFFLRQNLLNQRPWSPFVTFACQAGPLSKMKNLYLPDQAALKRRQGQKLLHQHCQHTFQD